MNIKILQPRRLFLKRILISKDKSLVSSLYKENI